MPNETTNFERPPFINRTREISDLDAFTSQSGARFMIVYGRRRIGKTTLLQHWLYGRPKAKVRGFFWVAHRSSPEILLRSFSEALSTCLEGTIAGKLRFDSWEDAFVQMCVMAREKSMVAGIDEFPYLLESVPGIASLLQKVWDSHKNNTQLKLVICGSQYHMMHEQFFSPKQPLYGRATGSLLLDEIAPQHLGLFLPRYSAIQAVETYAVLGGVPKYLEMWDDSRPVLHNVQELLLSTSTLFRHEAVFLIQDEIAEPRTYLAILEAIGGGLRTPITISKITGLPITHVGKYLHNLVALRIVRRVHSSESPKEGQTRLSRYEIRDPFLRFHFEFIHPHPDLVEQNRQGQHMEIIKQRFDSYVGKAGYEELARRHLTSMGAADQLPFTPDQVGRAWSPRTEVDVYAMNRKSQAALFGECRWTSRKMDTPVLTDLMNKAEGFPRLKQWKKHFVLFSRSGFTADLTRKAKAEGVILVDGPILQLAKEEINSADGAARKRR